MGIISEDYVHAQSLYDTFISVSYGNIEKLLALLLNLGLRVTHTGVIHCIHSGTVCRMKFHYENTQSYITFTFIHLADAFIQSDFQERALQKCISH